MNCPYCKSDAKMIDKNDGECTNDKCGGFFTLKPVWEKNKEWERGNEN